jgi:hypothetical protein
MMPESRRRKRMSRRGVCFAAAGLIVLLAAVCARGDVIKESTTEMEFTGALGTIMRVFGASEPVHSTEYYKGDLFRSDTMDDEGGITGSQIIDLGREVFISLNHEDETYTEMTFDEWRQMMEENLGELERSGEEDEEIPEMEWDLSVDISRPGDKEVIAGEEAEKVVIVLDFHGKATEQNDESGEAESVEGQMKVISSHWMADEPEGHEEIEAFQLKMADKLGIMPQQGAVENVLEAIAQSRPQLAQAIKELQEESENLAGYAVRIHTVYETRTAEGSRAQEAEEETEMPKSVGGFLKGLGKKVAKESIKKEESDTKVLMESSTEVIRFETVDIPAARFQVPEGYRLEER